MPQSKIVAGIEVGTSGVKVLIGDIVNGKSLNIIGMGRCSTRGIKKGSILDFKTVSNCTHAAIMGAEKSANVSIESVYLSQTGNHLQGVFNSGAVNVSSSHNQVRQNDIDRVCEEAKSKELPTDRVYIHHMQNGFFLDGAKVDDPLGKQGHKLEVHYWSVHGDEKKIRDQIHVINGFGLHVEDVIISSIASGVMVASENEKRQGVLVIDIGCGTTDWVYYHGGAVVRTGVVAVGSDHIINDLCVGIQINRKYAERLYLNFGKADYAKSDKSERVWMVGDQTIGDKYIAKYGMLEIIHARVEEIFSIIAGQLDDLCHSKLVPAGAILTGGVAGLPNIVSVAGKVMNIDVRLGQNPTWVREDLRALEFTTPLGLLHFALTGSRPVEDPDIAKDRGLLRKVAKLFALQ